MKTLQQLMLLSLLANSLTSTRVKAEERALSGSGSGDGGEDEDDDAFFAFDDYTKWDGYSIMPQQCINYNGQDVIVFTLHGDGNNNCAKKKQGMYYASVGDYLRGYNRQLKDIADIKGYDYERPEAMNYVDCTYTQYNNYAVYVKLGCGSGAGSNIMLNSYSDEYCTEPMQYNTNSLGLDLSGIRVQFGYCEECVYWPNNYDADADAYAYSDADADADADAYADADADADSNANFYDYHAYESSLCSAANYYKEDCNRDCKNLAKSVASQSSSSGKSGFSSFEKVMLFIFSLIGIFSLLAVRGQRMKMSREQALIEEAAVRKAGLQMKNIGLIIIVVVVLIIIFMIAKLRILTWVLLLTTDALLIGYWLFLHFKSTGKTEVGGFRIFGSGTGEVA